MCCYVEARIVMSGKAIFECNEKLVEIEPGDVIYVFPGELHSIKNGGNEPLITMVYFGYWN